MTPEVFIDTSAWYPLAVADHPDHGRLAAALRALVESGWRVVTTNLVVAETHALLLRRVDRDAALRFVREVRRDPLVVVQSTPELEDEAVGSWIARFDDQPFSFADAVSFSVMAERGITKALALDHHFSVAGFSRAP